MIMKNTFMGWLLKTLHTKIVRMNMFSQSNILEDGDTRGWRTFNDLSSITTNGVVKLH